LAAPARAEVDRLGRLLGRQTAYAGSAVYVGKDCNVFAVVQPGNGKCPGVPKDSEALLRAILTQKL